MKQIARKRRDVVPDIGDAKYGPKMNALPSDRHRAFIENLFIVRPGHGAAAKSAKLAGFGSETSSPQSIASISSRLMHNERVLDALREYSENFIRGSSPAALQALRKLISTPGHKDHARGISMILNRVHPAEMVSTIKVEHDVGPRLATTAAALQHISDLAMKVGIDVRKLPPLLDITPTKPEAST